LAGEVVQAVGLVAVLMVRQSTPVVLVEIMLKTAVGRLTHKLGKRF